jgi:hypothetical protein
VSPAGGEIGIGHFSYAAEGHGAIIRFDLHGDWIRLGGFRCGDWRGKGSSRSSGTFATDDIGLGSDVSCWRD